MRLSSVQSLERESLKRLIFGLYSLLHAITQVGFVCHRRKTIKKRMRAKLKAIKVELRKCMHDPITITGAWVKQMLQGSCHGSDDLGHAVSPR
jgi:hypothetical protein